jgi:CRP-like cAMP-binding protein
MEAGGIKVKSLFQIDKNLLGEFNIFTGMDESQIAKIAELLVPISYKKDACVWRFGAEERYVLLLVKGDVHITQSLTLFPSTGGNEHEYDKSIIHLTADQRPVIGEIALCANTTRSATLTASTDVKFYKLEAEGLEKLLEKDPRLGYLLYKNLSAVLAERLIASNKNIMKLTTAFSLALKHGT